MVKAHRASDNRVKRRAGASHASFLQTPTNRSPRESRDKIENRERRQPAHCQLRWDV